LSVKGLFAGQRDIRGRRAQHRRFGVEPLNRVVDIRLQNYCTRAHDAVGQVRRGRLRPGQIAGRVQARDELICNGVAREHAAKAYQGGRGNRRQRLKSLAVVRNDTIDSVVGCRGVRNVLIPETAGRLEGDNELPDERGVARFGKIGHDLRHAGLCPCHNIGLDDVGCVAQSAN
jgi:hypothetical protein